MIPPLTNHLFMGVSAHPSGGPVAQGGEGAMHPINPPMARRPGGVFPVGGGARGSMGPGGPPASPTHGMPKRHSQYGGKVFE